MKPRQRWYRTDRLCSRCQAPYGFWTRYVNGDRRVFCDPCEPHGPGHAQAIALQAVRAATDRDHATI